MPERDGVRYAHGGFISPDGISWSPVGRIDESGVAAPECDSMADDVVRGLMEPVFGTLSFSVPWWMDARARFGRILGIDDRFWKRRPLYTVRSLRRGGKSHRGKHA